jgi:dUTP pyrophosphatase
MDINKQLKDLEKSLMDLQNDLGISDEDSLNMTNFEYDFIKENYGVDIKELDEQLMNPTSLLDLKYQAITQDAVLPKYNYDSDSGFDLHSTEEITIEGFGRALIPTGLRFDIKDGYEIQVRTKSGLAINQGLMVLNSPGTVDSGYNGEVKVIIFNTNKEPFTITKGMKVAQAVLCPVVNGKWVDLIKVQEIKEKDRNANGFGSTGL